MNNNNNKAGPIDANHYNGEDDTEKEHRPFELFDDFDLTKTYNLTGDETWEDLVRLRRDVQRTGLSFYVDKVARRRWLNHHDIATPKTLALFYASELTDVYNNNKQDDGSDSLLLQEEINAILKHLGAIDNRNYVAKPTHLSCSGGVWLVKTNTTTTKGKRSDREDNDNVFISHGIKPFEQADESIDLWRQTAESLARELHRGPHCGSQQESWALENVKPGVMIEERFTSVDGNDDSGGMEFKVITIWGRVWLAQWRPGVSTVKALIHRNGTTLDWAEGNDDGAPSLPAWVDWERVVTLAETLGAHKDMFRTDIFVGLPVGSLPADATPDDRLAAVQYVVSETEVHPTPLKGTSDVFQEAARLRLAGYLMGNYHVIPDTEVPPEFLVGGFLPKDADL